MKKEEIQPRNIALPKLKDGVRLPDRSSRQSSELESETESEEEESEGISDKLDSQDVAMT